MASYPHCTCGILKNQEKEFSARFEFKSSSDRLRMTPQRGALLGKQSVKVYFVFEPKLSSHPRTEEPGKQAESKGKDQLKENEEKSKFKVLIVELDSKITSARREKEKEEKREVGQKRRDIRD